jgi:hypothetical protein
LADEFEHINVQTHAELRALRGEIARLHEIDHAICD